MYKGSRPERTLGFTHWRRVISQDDDTKKTDGAESGLCCLPGLVDSPRRPLHVITIVELSVQTPTAYKTSICF